MAVQAPASVIGIHGTGTIHPERVFQLLRYIRSLLRDRIEGVQMPYRVLHAVNYSRVNDADP
jgi:hypothetical protein